MSARGENKSPFPGSNFVRARRPPSPIEKPPVRLERPTKWDLVLQFGITPGRVIEIKSGIGGLDDLPMMGLMWTPSVAGSRAKTSVGLAMALDLTGSDPVYGENSSGLLASYDQNSSSWRTSQRSLDGEWTSFAGTWPASGMTRNGRLFRRAPWAHHICDSECSLWPTPTASMDGRGFGIPRHENTGRYKLSTVRRVHALLSEHGWRIHPRFTEALMGFPTGWTEITPSETLSRQMSLS
jgi:hypothetical protein